MKNINMAAGRDIKRRGIGSILPFSALCLLPRDLPGCCTRACAAPYAAFSRDASGHATARTAALHHHSALRARVAHQATGAFA